MTDKNAFGLPQMKRDIRNRSTHARTGKPALATNESVQSNPELQNAQQEYMNQELQSGAIG